MLSFYIREKLWGKCLKEYSLRFTWEIGPKNWPGNGSSSWWGLASKQSEKIYAMIRFFWKKLFRLPKEDWIWKLPELFRNGIILQDPLLKESQREKIMDRDLFFRFWIECWREDFKMSRIVWRIEVKRKVLKKNSCKERWFIQLNIVKNISLIDGDKL